MNTPIRSIAALALLLSVPAARTFTQPAKPAAPLQGSVIAARPIPLSDVRLLPGPIRDRLEQNRKYLLSLDVDRLVHNFRVNAGLPSMARPLGGWEDPTCELRGHFTGHYLSACALMFASTGDRRVMEKGNLVVDALAQCQQALGGRGYLSAFPEEFIDRVETGKRVWAPYYTLHKIMAGLLDMYVYCGNTRALTVVKGMAAWTKVRMNKLDARQVQQMLKTEFGGMAETLANLSAVTDDRAYLDLAQRFDKRSFLDPLADHNDQLQGLHANTHIPQVIGAAREYELTGDAAYRKAASFFWNEIVDARSYATGGTSNFELWRDEPYKLSDELSQESHENCCTYNMMRLTEHMFAWSPDVRFMDYYERALFNGILPTYHPTVGGAIMYYVPMKSGLFKMFGVPDSSYFCCNGSGIESFSKLGNNIYAEAGGTLYVNLFIASTVLWRTEDARVVQETRFPEQDWTTLRFSLAKPRTFTLKLRIPSWEVKGASAHINGTPVAMDIRSDGYLTISRTWREGDKVRLSMPMKLSVSHFVDDRTVGAIMYGPIVLAGALGRESMTQEMADGLGWEAVDRMVSRGAAVQTPTLVIPNADPNLWIEPVKGKPLTFRTVGVGKPNDVTLIPFYKLFGQRYAVYWSMYAPYEWQAMHASSQAAVPGVVDKVVVGNHRSEREHNFQSFRFQRGERMGEPWVKSALSVRYDLDVDVNEGNIVQCRFRGGEGSNAFELLIDGVSVVKDSLIRGNEMSIVDVKYPVPPELLRGKHRVSVMVKNNGGKSTPELYGCAMLRRGG